MKRLLLVLALCLPFLAFAQSEVLSNADIVKLTGLGLPSSAIISKIRNSKTNFKVGVDDLADLKMEGVNADVLSEMITVAAHEESEAAANNKDYRDPRTMRKAGIYYFNKSDTNNLFIPIDPTVISSSKSGGIGTALAQHYTYGIAQNKRVSSLSGAMSRRQIRHTKPRFYFYITNNDITPNEFTLVKLNERENSREMTVASSNAYGGSIGIDERQKVDFQYDQVADGIYKVYPQQPLEAGEYCFIYTGSAPTIFSRDKVYDFGIDVEPQN